MDSSNREEMNNRRRYAAEELFKMQERATMPPVPPFVRTGAPDRTSGSPPEGGFSGGNPPNGGFSGGNSPNGGFSSGRSQHSGTLGGSFSENGPQSGKPQSGHHQSNNPNGTFQSGVPNGNGAEFGNAAGGPAVFHEPQKPKKGIGGLLSGDILKLLNVENLELGSDRMLILLMILLLSEKTATIFFCLRWRISCFSLMFFCDSNTYFFDV